MPIKTKNKKGALAISQILILMIGIIAISYAVGTQVGVVEADGNGDPSTTPNLVDDQKTTSSSFSYGGNTYYLSEDGKYFISDKKTIHRQDAEENWYWDANDDGDKDEGEDFMIKVGEMSFASLAASLFKKKGEEKVAEKVGEKGIEDKIKRTALEKFAKRAPIVIAIVVLVSVIKVLNEGGGNYEIVQEISSATGGYLAGEAAYHVTKWAVKELGLATLGGAVGPTLATVLPWVAAAYAAYSAYNLIKSWFKKANQRSVGLQCKVWQPQTGGENCETCNNKLFPCTEYQCKSLGVGCGIINKNTDYQECFWNNSRDITPPTMNAWEDALQPGYGYDPLPPEAVRGVEIKYAQEGQEKECLPAWAPFSFGVTLDKRGYCRFEDHRTPSFEDMTLDFGGSNLWKINHSQVMSFPNIATLQAELEELGEEIEISIDENFEFYVRCANENGHANTEEFLFKFCIDKGPDTDQPYIVGFNWLDKSPISFFEENESHEVYAEAYVNEPAECRWDHNDRDYEDMQNNMTCATDAFNYNAQLTYTCSGTLTGLENRKENKFYFRCEDSAGNVNQQSRVLSLIGTQPLVISSAGPDAETIKGATGNVKVTLEATTSAGYEEGRAVCSYSATGDTEDYTLFDNTDSHQHSTDVRLTEGIYNYHIRCNDLGGNFDSVIINFAVETDTKAPTVVRVYKEGSNLKIITDEPAECVYDLLDCTYLFDDGLPMVSHDDTSHVADWNTQNTFYIKCRDEFENQPSPDQCSIIARPFEL